jgi:hypothetical protein
VPDTWTTGVAIIANTLINLLAERFGMARPISIELWCEFATGKLAGFLARLCSGLSLFVGLFAPMRPLGRGPGIDVHGLIGSDAKIIPCALFDH